MGLGTDSTKEGTGPPREGEVEMWSGWRMLYLPRAHARALRVRAKVGGRRGLHLGDCAGCCEDTLCCNVPVAVEEMGTRGRVPLNAPPDAVTVSPAGHCVSVPSLPPQADSYPSLTRLGEEGRGRDASLLGLRIPEGWESTVWTPD